MKALVVYYSLTGNTRFIAQAIAKELGADVLELRLKDEPKNIPGLMKFFWAGKQVFSKERPELLPLDKNPQEYDILVLGTPIWAYNYVPAFETFFSEHKITGKNIALFCCHGGGKKDAIEIMGEKLEGNNIISALDFIEPLHNDEEDNLHKAICWAEELKKTVFAP